MKLHYFLILLVGLSITSTINGTSFSGNDISYKDSFISQLTENYPLYLEGEFSQSSTRSLQSLPVEAAISEGILYVEFSTAVGEVNLSIEGAGQVVYTSTADVVAPWHLISIPLDNYNPGTYKLELTNGDGGYVYGEFTIE
ncbi:DUF3244 domain-containing protein [Oscillospiraceae bacterium N12]|uniref:DUF3244 domain-containing protein n=1 Tax=Jilunia laotingensis TaxID=2763675 RepID=A0A926FB06_9BACT|nr:DUF3244 domain-containing protein [Jilunia laotingensis]MBC8595045.1 DUF3244 domain-containing protein [Jilunia laotingensis]